MRSTWAIFKKELRAYFLSPVAYAVAGVFLLLSGYFFSVIMLTTRTAEMRAAFGNMSIVLIFVVPLLTMRLLAEEVRQGTAELLLTCPLRSTHIILGKYLASLVLYLAMLAMTGIYPWVLLRFGNPDPGPIISGYLGIFLLGASFLAVGLFASSVTDSNIVAAMVAFGLLLLLWVLGWAGEALGGRLGDVLTSLALFERLNDFRKGIIDSSNCLHYLSYIVGFLFLAGLGLERRRWG